MVGKEGFKELGEMFIPKKTELEVPRPNFQTLPEVVNPFIDIMLMFGDAINGEENKNPAVNILKGAISRKEISFTEAIMICTFVVFAGYEPTSSILSNCVAHLAENPKTYNSLKEDPESIGNFIEESLRVYTPVGRFIRRANKEVKIGEQIIPINAIVIVMLGAANADPIKYENPYSHNYKRENAQTHLSFGKGIHYCLGAGLARYQTKIAIEELISKTSSLALDKDFDIEIVTDRDNGILRYEKLYVVMEPK